MKISRIRIPFICHQQWMNEQVAQIWHCHGNNKFTHCRLPYIVQESVKTPGCSERYKDRQTQLHCTSLTQFPHREGSITFWPNQDTVFGPCLSRRLNLLLLISYSSFGINVHNSHLIITTTTRAKMDNPPVPIFYASYSNYANFLPEGWCLSK